MNPSRTRWIKLAELQPGFTLQPHQQRLTSAAADAAREGRPFRVLAYWGTGAGKSLGALGAVDALGGSSAFVGPAAMRPTLRQEQQRFLGRSDIPVQSYHAAAAGRLAVPQTLAIDEAQRLGSSASTQATSVADLARSAKNVILMSGTPIRNSPEEFAPLLSVLTNQPISHDEFRRRFVGTETTKPGWMGWLKGLKSVTNPSIVNTDELRSMLDGKVDYYQSDNPSVDVVNETHEAEMTPRQSELYEAMFGKLPWIMRLKLRWNYPLTDDELVRARSFLTGPRQVALSDLPYRSDGDPHRAFLNSGKLTKAYGLLKDELTGDKRKKGIVFSSFPRAGLEPMAAALAKDGIPHAMFHGKLSDQERKQMVEDFNAGRTRVALVAPAGAEGISLKGAQILQVLDNGWNDARTQQVIGRGIRYDSHTYLPPELRKIRVQKFVARLPLSTRDRLLDGLGFDRSANRTAVDDYMAGISDRKEILNKQFLQLLKEIGTPKTASDIRVLRDTLTDGEFEKLTEVVKSAAQKFYKPENYDKIRDLPGGRELWAGANDWEAGWTWAWVTPKGGGEPLSFTRVDHTECPGCKGTGEDSSAKADSLCVRYGKARVEEWASDHTKSAAEQPNPYREAKRYSDTGTPDGYAQKADILRKLIAANPDQWRIDSTQPHTVGLTHVSGWRYHLPRWTLQGLPPISGYPPKNATS